MGWCSELDQRVDSMGPVNLDAIQEFDELEQRYNFLEKQNTDLINSKAELLGHDHENQSKRRKILFADTFEKIRVNFQEMFTELFGGGKANLVLTDESDPARERHRHHRQAARQAADQHHAAVRRREDDDRRGAALLDLHGEAKPVLRAG